MTPDLSHLADVTNPRDPALAAMSDEEFLRNYSGTVRSGGTPDDPDRDELLRRVPALRLLAAYRRQSYRHDVDRAGGHPNPVLLQLAPESEETRDLAEAYRAVWEWIVLSEDESLRARPTMLLSEVLAAAGIRRATWDGYVSRGQVPPRVGHDWHTGEQVWDAAVVRHWLLTRRRRAARAGGL